MKQIAGYFSTLLLGAFLFLQVPVQFLHDAFADHVDALCVADGDGFANVEAKHSHCDIFCAATGPSDGPVLAVIITNFPDVVAKIVTTFSASEACTFFSLSPARGPPVC